MGGGAPSPTDAGVLFDSVCAAWSVTPGAVTGAGPLPSPPSGFSRKRSRFMSRILHPSRARASDNTGHAAGMDFLLFTFRSSKPRNRKFGDREGARGRDFRRQKGGPTSI